VGFSFEKTNSLLTSFYALFWKKSRNNVLIMDKGDKADKVSLKTHPCYFFIFLIPFLISKT